MPATYERLSARLTELDRTRGLEGNRLFYLATPPAEFSTILHRLKAADCLHDPHDESFTRVIIEKPFGRDLESARTLNALVARVLDESQIFRIDHYLGKETVQNILVFRFGNSIFEPLWNRKYVDHVEITRRRDASASRGAASSTSRPACCATSSRTTCSRCCRWSRWSRRPPSSADDIRDEKLKVLRSLRPMPGPRSIERDVVLGQYRGYRDEPGVAPDSRDADLRRDARVRRQLALAGRAVLPARGQEARQARHRGLDPHARRSRSRLFGRDDVCEHVEPNVLTLRIQPDEGISLRFVLEGARPRTRRRPRRDGHALRRGVRRRAARGLRAAAARRMRGDATLFSRRDAVEASWSWITPMLQHVESHPSADFPNYEPGSWGPVDAEQMPVQDGRHWVVP